MNLLGWLVIKHVLGPVRMSVASVSCQCSYMERILKNEVCGSLFRFSLGNRMLFINLTEGKQTLFAFVG